MRGTIKLNDFIERNEVVLTSGIKSNIYYNFRKMSDRDKKEVREWIKRESRRLDIIGIKTMGWEIVKELEKSIWYDPHTDTICKIPKGDYVIFDDVITTFGSVRKCILKVGKEPFRVLCIKNRLKIVEFF